MKQLDERHGVKLAVYRPLAWLFHLVLPFRVTAGQLVHSEVALRLKPEGGNESRLRVLLPLSSLASRLYLAALAQTYVHLPF